MDFYGSFPRNLKIETVLQKLVRGVLIDFFFHLLHHGFYYAFITFHRKADNREKC